MIIDQSQSYSYEKINHIINIYFPSSKILSIEALEKGNINNTFKVELLYLGSRKIFILQKLNTYVFTNPHLLVENLYFIVPLMKEKIKILFGKLNGRRWVIPELLLTGKTNQKLVEYQGDCWRALEYVKYTKTIRSIPNTNYAKELGLGLAIFHNCLIDIPVDNINITIPSLHNVRYILNNYDKARQDFMIPDKWSEDYKLQLHEIICFINLHRDKLFVFEEALNSKKLSLGLMHGDPKIENMLIDNYTEKVVSLIDLDTVQPGLILYDLADLLRSCCNLLGEDCDNPQEIYYDLEAFKYTLDGYFSLNPNILDDQEFNYLLSSLIHIPLLLSIRFVSDFLLGNKYFKVNNNFQNLIRANVQIELIKSIFIQREQILNIISSYKKN